MKTIPAEQTRWTTSAGTFNRNRQALIQIIHPEIHKNKTLNCHIAPTLGDSDIINGRNILRQLGIILNFQQETFYWDNAIIPSLCLIATQ
jgi:hypothetical protein